MYHEFWSEIQMRNVILGMKQQVEIIITILCLFHLKRIQRIRFIQQQINLFSKKKKERKCRIGQFSLNVQGQSETKKVVISQF